jgi:DhnA family fructose-bisphosphate aldolase class Ia
MSERISTGPISADEFATLRDLRTNEPHELVRLIADRRRRDILVGDRKLFIVAADHPARGALAVRSDSMAMASRYDLLQRLATALSRPGVDGVLGTPDILEDLAALGVLDDKVLVGSMNRGGLRSSRFEMDDRFTGYDVESITRSGIDFGKLLLRVNLEDPATAGTLENSAAVITKAAAARLPILIEPFMSQWVDGKIVNDLSTDAVITSVAIASGLGATSAYSWLKLPVVPEMERVMEATTLPTVLLGGDPRGRPDDIYRSWAEALALPGVRGLVVGRTLLYPADDDVAAAVDTASALVHTPAPIS